MRRYLYISDYFKNKFNGKIYKISIDAGFNCPGRCIYCTEWGSLAPYQRKIRLKRFSDIEIRKQYIKFQIQNALEFYKRRKLKNLAGLFLYFQAFSNTFAKVELLKEIYDFSLSLYNFKGLIIGTRPDLINREKIQLISEYTKNYEVWIEYGLQSACDKTLRIIKRGHTYKDFEDAILLTKKYSRDIKIGTHIIIGLPGENLDDNICTVKRISELPINGIKFHYLYIMKNSEILKLYEKGEIKILDEDRYLKILSQLVKYLRKDIVIFRLFSDPEPDSIAPRFNSNKSELFKKFNNILEINNIYQGENFEKNNS